MTSTDKNARAAWATLTHDSLNNGQTGKRTLTGLQFFFLNFGLLLGNILVLFNTGAFASVVLHATGDLGVSPSHASWMQTYYFISLALALPISSWLAAAVGEVRLYFAAMITMTLASLLCAVTGDLYGSDVVYHGEVQGLGAGTGSVFGLLPPDNATGNYIHIVERVPVRIGLRAEELKANPLLPGLSAVVRDRYRQSRTLGSGAFDHDACYSL